MKKRVLSCILAGLMLAGLLGAVAPVPASAAEAGEESAPVLNFGQTITASNHFALAIKEDGSVWGWGYDETNTLGRHELGYNYLPVQVPLDKPMVSVSSKTLTALAITADGELWNWGGDQGLGGMGREVDGHEVEPGRVMGNASAVDGGDFHTAALTGSGEVWTWGSNNKGQLGNGGEGLVEEYSGTVYEPLPVLALDSVKSISTGDDTTFAIRSDGSLWAWGENTWGELGIDSETWEFDPEKDAYKHLCSNVGNAYSEYHGQVWSRYQTTPVKVMDHVAQVDADWYTILLKEDGTVWTCGFPHRDSEDPEKYTFAPGQWYTLEDVAVVRTGNSTFAAVKKDGSLWTWSVENDGNQYGQLGRDTSDGSISVPGKVMDDVVDVAIGNGYMLALKSDGSLWSWGTNLFCQLGVGEETESSAQPVKVMDGVALPNRYTQSLQEIETAEPDEALIQLAAIRQEQAVWDTTPWTQRAMSIPDCATYLNGNAYLFYSCQDCTWDQAENYCLSVGGHLATITSREEQEFVGRRDKPYWIGAHRDQYGSWTWVTGESWTYNAWHPGENDNYGGYEDTASVWGDGWCDVSNNVVGTAGFICEWETAGRWLPTPPAPVYSVTFCTAAGSQLDTIRKQVVQGETYGWLPTPTLEGWSFVGWFTQPDGGRMITSSTQVNQSESIFLYAMWNKTSGGPTVPALSYSFGNNSYEMNYDENYKIPLDRYIALFGDNQFARKCYEITGAWNGSCSGMASSALMLYMGGATGVSVSDFRAGAVSAAELQLGDVSQTLGWTLRDFIEVMQQAQRSPLVQSSKANDYYGMVQAAVNYNANGTKPVLLSIKGPRNEDGSRPGHALVALGAWRKDETTDCITVYDPNWPGNVNRFVEIYRDSQGRYCGWRYELFDGTVWGSAYDSAPIYYKNADGFYEVWNNRGTSYVCSGQTMKVNSRDASVYDYAGNLVATIRDGEVQSLRADVTPVAEPEEGSAGEGGGVTLWIPNEYFTVVNEDEGVETLWVTVSGVDSTVSVSTSADRALIYANGEDSVALVSGEGETYEMVFRSGEDDEVRLSGTARADVPTMAARLSGELSGVGLEPDSGAARTTVLDVVTSTVTGSVSVTFSDVSGGSEYAPAVQWALEEGLVSGTALGRFDPEVVCTRAQAATLLWRALGSPTAAGTASCEDVGEGSYYSGAAAWAAGAGVMPCDGGRFDPNRVCSGRDMLTYLWNALGCPGAGEDRLAGFATAMEWAEGTGLLTGTDAAADPDSPCLRRDMIVFLYRALA